MREGAPVVVVSQLGHREFAEAAIRDDLAEASWLVATAGAQGEGHGGSAPP